MTLPRPKQVKRDLLLRDFKEVTDSPSPTY